MFSQSVYMLDWLYLTLWLNSPGHCSKQWIEHLLHKSSWSPHHLPLRWCYYRHLIYCTLVYCASQILHFIQIQNLWQPCIKWEYWHHFPRAFADFRSLSHILVILAIFQTFLLLLHLLWWSVITDLCYYYSNCFGASWKCSYNTVNNK